MTCLPQKAKDRLGFVPSDLDSTFKSTVEWYDHIFLHDDHEREEMIARLLQNIVPPNKKNQVMASRYLGGREAV